MRQLFRVLLVACTIAPLAAWSWGFAGHRKLASKIYEPLPGADTQGCLKMWLKTQATQYSFQDAACDPDRWRETTSANYDPAEPPRHYLDIDYATPIESYPRDWNAVVAKFGNYADDNGQVPWRVEDYYNQLVTLFRNKDSAGAALHIARFTHYLDDPFSPLHDTKNSFPSLGAGDTVGGHTRYESDMLQVSSYLTTISNNANSYYGTVGRADPKNNIFDAIIVGNPLSAVVANAYTQNNGDLQALFNATNNLTSRRWGDALTLIASVISSAWVDAGKPMLTGMQSGCVADVPQGEMRLVGYPLPVAPDAGTPDSGTGGGSGGGGGAGGGAGGGGSFNGTGGGGGGDPTTTEPVGCQGCGGAGAILFLPFVGLALIRRRRDE